MCDQERHQSLTPPEHFMRHTIEVERACATTRRGLGGVSLENVIESARDALTLADPHVSPECIRMLQLVVEGDLETAAR